jgi:hypothetical protein
MTIKQQGGVFGRHPSFSRVTAEQIAISSSGSFGGNVSVNGNVVLASGGGVDFSATSGTGTSELFDDYEEGTWTPELSPATGSFTTMTYQSTSGQYTKVGDLVFVQGDVRTSDVNVTGASGNLSISGLPYTSESSEDAALPIGLSLAWGTNTPLTAQVSNNSTEMLLLYRTSTSGGISVLQVSDLQTGTGNNRNRINFAGCYKV